MPNPNAQEFGYRLLAVGTDTEIFLRDKVTKQSVPVIGLLGGTKHEPLPVLEGGGFSVQEDNVMAEFNIPPAYNPETFSNRIDRILCFLNGHFSSKGLELNISPAAVFDYKSLNNLQAQTFGCDPDYCVWTLSENDVDTINPLLRKMRTAGGHIHISFMHDGKIPELQDLLPVVKGLDLFLGVPSILLDEDIQRRQIYGKAGAFRPKQYTPKVSGVEYRTLSNFWIRSQKLSSYVFSQIVALFQFLNTHSDAENLLEEEKIHIIETINTNNKDMAQKIISNWNLKLPNIPNSPNVNIILTTAFPQMENPPSIEDMLEPMVNEDEEDEEDTESDNN